MPCFLSQRPGRKQVALSGDNATSQRKQCKAPRGFGDSPGKNEKENQKLQSSLHLHRGKHKGVILFEICTQTRK